MEDLYKPLTDEEEDRVRDKLFIASIGDVIYVLYSEQMEMYMPYVVERFDDEPDIHEMIEYCRLHDIKILPISLKKSNMSEYIEHLRIRKNGCHTSDMTLVPIIIRCVFQATINQYEDKE